MSRGRVAVWNRESLTRALQQLATDLGRRPTCRDVDAAPRSLMPWANTYIKHFGSLEIALGAAGLDTTRRRSSPAPWTRCKAGHPLTPDNLYAWPRTVRRADGSVAVVVFRRCKTCHKACARRQWNRYLARRGELPARPRTNRGWFKPKLRVVKPDVARRHSPTAMRAYWGVAS